MSHFMVEMTEKDKLSSMLAQRNYDLQNKSKCKDFKILNSLCMNKMYNQDEVNNNRFDVNAKKILRFARLFYDKKLEDQFKVKKLRRKIKRQAPKNQMQ